MHFVTATDGVTAYNAAASVLAVALVVGHAVAGYSNCDAAPETPARPHSLRLLRLLHSLLCSCSDCHSHSHSTCWVLFFLLFFLSTQAKQQQKNENGPQLQRTCVVIVIVVIIIGIGIRVILELQISQRGYGIH